MSIFTITPLTSIGQRKADSLLIKLNKIYKANRVILTGEVGEVFINKTKKTLDIDDCIIPLDNYTAYYQNSYNEYYKKKMDIVYLKCLNGNCQLDQKTNEYNSGFGIFFKSKKVCYDFINILDEIKEELINNIPSP